ncbi:MAG: hypothetical protein JST40_06190 [Armatimonadetes bacterium]|nr:hypothetical protein [Armatimonadota bacterium]
MKRILIGVVVVVVLGLVGFVGLKMLNRPSDQQQIQIALNEAIAAAKEGKPGPVLDFVSGRATLDGQGGASKGEIGDWIRKAKPDVTIVNPTATIEENKATISTPVKIKLQLLTFQQDFSVPDVKISLEKEFATEYGFIPSSKWRVVSVDTKSAIGSELWNQ